MFFRLLPFLLYQAVAMTKAAFLWTECGQSGVLGAKIVQVERNAK
jgi:hypothetical protein